MHRISPLLCHRDVKSFNYLVDYELNAKIADLELGGEDDKIDAARDGMLCCWLAPEVLSGEGTHTQVNTYSGFLTF